MKKMIVLLAIFAVISLGCVGKDKLQTNDRSGSQTVTDENGNSYDWCISNIVNQSNKSDTGFTIKGITEYQGIEVCEAEWKYEGGSVTEYFTEDGNATMIYKDINGNIINNTNEEDVTINDNGTTTNETISTNITIRIPKE